MYELRFALIGLSVVLLAGLTWWELRRGRATRDYRESRPADRQEPRLDGREGVSGDLAFIDDDDEPIIASRHAPETRVDPGASPPVVTIDDLPDDVEEVELADYTEPGDRPLLHRYDDLAPRTQAEPPAPAARAEAEPPLPPARPRAPETVAPATVAPRPGTERPRHRGTRDASVDAAADKPPEQRIVAIRMAAGATPASGRALLAALQAEGLEFGRYAIFHRQRDDGRMLFSAASLLEPGSFDLDLMPTQTFPGVSLFAVFPGPVDAANVFDDMLATARRLADRLGGSLQDERGQSLTAQRILAMREELVHFQNMVTKIRARSGG